MTYNVADWYAAIRKCCLKKKQIERMAGPRCCETANVEEIKCIRQGWCNEANENDRRKSGWTLLRLESITEIAKMSTAVHDLTDNSTYLQILRRRRNFFAVCTLPLLSLFWDQDLHPVVLYTLCASYYVWTLYSVCASQTQQVVFMSLTFSVPHKYSS